ncbi:co-chaperone YbbN [Haloglycomyces albus]|uniref:co-chaperone YbbN n=1 Tax=Haloglycomyces albus TaxID=526067 RepID=UPI00046D55F8|nr:tetratricopeptide repeat protein [Haloglycomyces albus]
MSDQVPSRFASGAVDLSALQQQAQQQQAPTGPSQPAAAPSEAMGPSSGVVAVDVTDATVQSEVLERSANTLVILVFWADQSPESVTARDQLEQMAHNSGGAWSLAKADVQSNQQLAAALQLQSLPALVAFAGGRPVDLVQGPQTQQGLQDWINKVASAAGMASPTEVDPELASADDALMNGDLDTAEAAYTKYLKNHPGSNDAEVGLAQVKLMRRASSAPEDVVTKADANPADVDGALAAADVEMLSGQPEAAFERLLAVVARTAGDDKEHVRQRLVELFSIAGADDPAVNSARRKLSALLF